MRLSLSFILILSAVIILMLLVVRSEVGYTQFSSSRKYNSLMSRPVTLILTELMTPLIWTMTMMVKESKSNV